MHVFSTYNSTYNSKWSDHILLTYHPNLDDLNFYFFNFVQDIVLDCFLDMNKLTPYFISATTTMTFLANCFLFLDTWPNLLVLTSLVQFCSSFIYSISILIRITKGINIFCLNFFHSFLYWFIVIIRLDLFPNKIHWSINTQNSKKSSYRLTC